MRSTQHNATQYHSHHETDPSAEPSTRPATAAAEQSDDDHSDDDLAIEVDRTEALTASGVISINDAAGCSLSGPVETEIERDGSHSEITASWLFVCDDPDDIDEVDLTQLFTGFPSFEDIDAQWISESEQSSAELSPSAPTLSLRG